MRLSLIGPGDIQFHFQKILEISEEKFKKEIEKIAEALAESGAEIVVLPDRGISFQIAKLYKLKGGKKVIWAIPKDDKTFGTKHLESYIQEKVNGKMVCDEIINTGDWYKHDLIKGLLGNAILYLGSSPGTNGELNYAVYLYKLISGYKEEVEIAGRKIHPEIKADKNFKIFVYSPFLISGKLSSEDERYIKEFGINLVYVKNAEELKRELKN